MMMIEKLLFQLYFDIMLDSNIFRRFNNLNLIITLILKNFSI
jgi:hypothetical protein